MLEPDDIAHVFQVPCGPRGGKYTPTVSPQSAERAWYRMLGSNQPPSGQSSAAEIPAVYGHWVCDVIAARGTPVIPAHVGAC